MSIAAIVTRGFGSFGSIGEIVTAGYTSASGAGTVVTPTTTTVVQVGGGGFESWQDYVKALHEKRQLAVQLKKKKAELKKVEKKIAVAKKNPPEHPQGILANLFRLELKREELRTEIHAKESELLSLQWLIEAVEIDEDDEEVMLLS